MASTNAPVQALATVAPRVTGGLALGLAGVVVLINPLAARAPDLLASGVALRGALCWGCGSVYAKRAAEALRPARNSSLRPAILRKTADRISDKFKTMPSLCLRCLFMCCYFTLT